MSIHTARSSLLWSTKCLIHHIYEYTGYVTWQVASGSKEKNAWVYNSASPIRLHGMDRNNFI